MVKQEDFEVERWMDEYETKVQCNIAETCCYSLTISQVEKIIGKKFPVDALLDIRLGYGSIPGSTQLRSAIAEIINATSPGCHISVDASNVLVSNGAIGANFLVYYALVDPGDHVVIVDPAYQQLQSVPAMFGAKVDFLPHRPENGFLPLIEDLRKLVKKGQTKLININSPHNPSGAVLPDKLLREIVEIARGAGAWLLCDEVYRPLYHSLPAGEPEPVSVACLYEKGIITGSTSKAFSLAGLRLGWVVTPSKFVIDECMKRRDYNTISVSVVDDAIATWALSGWRKIIEYNYQLCLGNLKIVDEFVAGCNGKAKLVRPSGGTVMFLEIVGVTNTKKFCADFINKYSVLIVPGETFNKPGFVRIGFANATDDLRYGLSKLQEYILSL
jgi:aspartate/methionine/tyrosine aminotransferase